MGMSFNAYYSADMVRNLPDDGKRYETVYGELLVTPAPNAWHQELCRRLSVSLSGYLTIENVGKVFCSPADISWSEDVLVQPDVFVVDADQARTYDWAEMTKLRLVIEVLSPSSRKSDRFAKRKLYQAVGVPLYWVVDPEAELVEIWTPDVRFPEVGADTVIWAPSGASKPFELDLKTLFER